MTEQDSLGTGKASGHRVQHNWFIFLDAKTINNLSVISNRNKNLQSNVMHSGFGSSVCTCAPALIHIYYIFNCISVHIYTSFLVRYSCVSQSGSTFSTGVVVGSHWNLPLVFFLISKLNCATMTMEGQYWTALKTFPCAYFLSISCIFFLFSSSSILLQMQSKTWYDSFLCSIGLMWWVFLPGFLQ